jgi:transforming growth factor-beta-induced protein
MKTIAFIAAPLLALATLPFVATAEPATINATRDANIVDVAKSTGVHGTLLTAATAAGMVDALSGPGPLTVFAPVDSAFAAVDAKLLASLLEPANVETLREVLGFHVVAGRFTAADVVKVTELRTLSGQRLPVDVRPDGVFVGGAKVTTADVAASNGVVHVIDAVMLPATTDLVATASGAGSFKTLLAAVQAAGLVETLNGGRPFTVLAPTDAAFAALDQKLLASLLEPANKQRLVSVLQLHVIPGRLSALELAAAGTVETIGGVRLPVRVEGGRITVGGVALSGNDVESTNATIHVLEAVVLPR